MKKIFSLLLTAAMMISTASAVFAADYNYELTPAASEAEIGNTVKFVLKIDTNPGMLYQKNVIEFNPEVFERVDYMQSSVDPDTEEIIQIPHTVFSGLGGDYTINQDTPGKIILVWGNSSPKTGTIIARFNLKVKNDAEIVNGDYEVTVTPEQIKDSANADMSVAPAKAVVTVTGGKEPETAKTHAVIDDTISGTIPAVNSYYSKGFKVEITPNDDEINKVSYALACEGKTSLEDASGAWEGLTLTGASNYSFAINVINIPDTIAAEDITNNWTVDVTVAE